MKRKRIKTNNAGFSLAETLLAILILLLVSSIVAAGLPVARDAYEKVVIGANAQAMLSTAVAALRDELGTAWQVKVSADQSSVSYFKADTGAKATLSRDGDYPSITLLDFDAVDFIRDTGATTGGAHHLVPDANTDLYVTYSSIAYSDGVVSISGLEVRKQKEQSKVMASLGTGVELKIRVLSGNAVES